MSLSPAEDRDLVIGCVGGYEWDKVQLWANSLRRSGFSGRKMLVVYSATNAFLQRAAQEGFFLVTFARDAAGNAVPSRKTQRIVVDRFYDIWALDSQPLFKAQGLADSRYVIVTDVRDIVFQSNPSAWLSAHATRPLIVGSEAIRFRDEDWGRDNLVASFGRVVYETLQDKIICNAGAIAGHWRELKDLFLQIYLMSCFNPVFNPDQAALNILVHSEPYRQLVQFNALADAWCANIGATADPTKPQYASRLVEPDAIHLDDAAGLVKNKDGKTYCLVHQYDRNPAMSAMVARKYA